MKKSKIEKQSEIAMISVTIIWGLGFPITQLAIVYGYNTFSITAARFLIGALLLAIIFHKRLRYFGKEYILPGILTGTIMFLGFSLQTKGLAYTTGGNAAFLTQVAVVFTPFIYWSMFRKPPNKYIFIATFISLLGVFILIGGINIKNTNVGDLLVLGCAITVSLQVVLIQLFITKYNLDPVIYTLWQFSTIFILSFIAALITETLPPLSIQSIWPLVFLGVFNTALGFTTQSIAIKHLSSTRVSIIISLESLVGAIASIIILNEDITINLIVGGLLIIFAVIVSETKLEFITKYFYANKKSV